MTILFLISMAYVILFWYVIDQAICRGDGLGLSYWIGVILACVSYTYIIEFFFG